MTGDELVDEFVVVCRAVFSSNLDMAQRTAKLEAEVKTLVAKYSSVEEGEERKMVCETPACRT